MAQQAAVVYDGFCILCQNAMRLLKQLDVNRRFVCVPSYEEGLRARFPALARADFALGVWLVEPGGSAHVGADAVYRIARRLPLFEFIAWLYLLAPVRALVQRLYGWIAQNRYRLFGRVSVTADVAAPSPFSGADGAGGTGNGPGASVAGTGN